MGTHAIRINARNSTVDIFSAFSYSLSLQAGKRFSSRPDHYGEVAISKYEILYVGVIWAPQESTWSFAVGN